MAVQRLMAMFAGLMVTVIASSGIAACDSEDPVVYCEDASECLEGERCTFFEGYRGQVCAEDCGPGLACPAGFHCEVGAACGDCNETGCIICDTLATGCLPD